MARRDQDLVDWLASIGHSHNEFSGQELKWMRMAWEAALASMQMGAEMMAERNIPVHLAFLGESIGFCGGTDGEFTISESKANCEECFRENEARESHGAFPDEAGDL